MAISVKNHEDRIVALENKIFKQTVTLLWSGFARGGQSITLNESISSFDLLIVYGGTVTWGWTEIIVIDKDVSNQYKQPATGGEHGAFLIHVIGAYGMGFDIRDIDFNTIRLYQNQGESTEGVHRIYGIKFSNVILYYVSNIIYTKFKLRLNSAIAIFNRLFLHKFI